MTTVEVLKELNDDQKKPVIDYHGPSFIVAGPGSGKTKTIVSRTAYMIINGIDPSSILLFTFTNKAAKELKDRVSKEIGPTAKQITVGTYHSVCSRILRKYAETMGFNKSFTIFDTEDSTKLLKRLVKGSDIDTKDLAEYISEKKRNLLSPSTVLQNVSANNDQRLAELYERYQQELYRQDAMDFDDLIYYTIKLLEYNPDILERINTKYTYITADEFHDSSRCDIRLIELLAGTKKNICCILDDEQSIYGFRGADIEAVLGVQDLFQVKRFILHQNYRSTKMIVNAARSLIGKNKRQIEKTIYTHNEEGTPIIFFEEQSSEKEALRVRKIVKLVTQKYGLDYQDVAVLYRMSYLSRAIEDELLKEGIPYEIVGGTPFMSRHLD
jgi:DNA helicase-2/ATP-dependent DNA helicase PcrA